MHWTRVSDLECICEEDIVVDCGRIDVTGCTLGDVLKASSRLLSGDRVSIGGKRWTERWDVE